MFPLLLVYFSPNQCHAFVDAASHPEWLSPKAKYIMEELWVFLLFHTGKCRRQRIRKKIGAAQVSIMTNEVNVHFVNFFPYMQGFRAMSKGLVWVLLQLYMNCAPADSAWGLKGVNNRWRSVMYELYISLGYKYRHFLIRLITCMGWLEHAWIGLGCTSVPCSWITEGVGKTWRERETSRKTRVVTMLPSTGFHVGRHVVVALGNTKNWTVL